MVTTSASRIGEALVYRYRLAERAAYRRTPHLKNGVRCTSCGWKGARFGPSAKPRLSNRICPQCLSTERGRALMLWLENSERAIDSSPSDDRVVLEVAPIGLLQQRCEQRGDNYVSLDLRPEAANVCGDLCDAPFPDGSVDLLVCFHVLEHVPDDLTAIAEIARVLSNDGVAILSVPWNPTAEQTFEDPDADPADFERLYGQHDHLRMYGRDFTKRLQSAGLAVEEQIWTELFTNDEMTVHALAGSDDRFWVCRRDPK